VALSGVDRLDHHKPSREKNELLADVAEMYYFKGLNQTEIARHVGVDRSMISRMLTEARKQSIVEIRINRPMITDPTLEQMIQERFGLKRTFVVVNRESDYPQILQRLGIAGASVLQELIHDDMVVGLSWGTAVSAVVDAVKVELRPSIRIVQLVGALGAQNSVYDGPRLVQRLAQKFGCEGYFLNAPFIVDNPTIAAALLENQNIKEAITMARQCDTAVLGIGSTDPQFSSFYRAGYVPIEELEILRSNGMVGDVCGHHFNLEGESLDLTFHQRIVTIRPEDLKKIPTRIGVAGGSGKVEPVLGALRADFINVLVIDDLAANALLCCS
jgi:DNA-binding transcriptional regulator LsrR (DeoR family)